VGEAKTWLIYELSLITISLILPLIHDFSANENRLEVQHRVLFDRLDLSLVLAH